VIPAMTVIDSLDARNVLKIIRSSRKRNLFVRGRDSDTSNEGIINDRSVGNHVCFKRFCSKCMCQRETGHLCYMAPLSPEIHSSNRVLYVFYNFETTQNTKVTESATIHVPNLVCVQQFCTLYEEDLTLIKTVIGVARGNTFWDDPVGDLLT
jgi:hypothetical protein